MKDLLFKGVTFACMPIFVSYQSRVLDHWNSNRKQEAFSSIKEALSFEFLVFIILFIIFMVVKEGLFLNLLRIPAMDSWEIYLPILLSAFVWQMTILLQRFLDLMFRQAYLLIIIAGCTVFNIGANLLLVPVYGFRGASLVMLATVILYAVLILLFSWLARRKHPDR
jgi:O-antigen/teichoic acid export membrane protein